LTAALDPDGERRRLFDVAGLGVLVTGAGSGIGAAVAGVLARCGARVLLTDVDRAAADARVAELAAEGADVASGRLDVAAPDADTVLDELCEQLVAGGGLHVVVANAGISAGPGPRTAPGRLTATDPAAWDRVIAVNQRGTFATLRAAARHIARDGRGRVLVTASIAGLQGDPMVGYAYAMSKAASVALVRQAAADLAPDVRVNAIAPGSIVTGIGGGRTRDPHVATRFAGATMLGRMGNADELAGLALFLAAPASSYVTGAVFTVDGGASAWRAPS
jgi:NAD(P)-dependent dehydrogenase (short-subunit alcohol dehydrogenase family)